MALIYLIDEDESMLEIERTFLQDCYEICSFFSIEQAKVAIRENRPELVITEVQMMDQKGAELVRELHEQGIPVICVAADGNKMLRLKCRSSGAAGYILKPPTREEFMEVVNGCFPQV